MQINYCLPIIAKDKQAVLDEITRHEKDYACFEVWLDYIEGADDTFVRELIAKYPGKLLMLFRRRELEPIQMPLENRQRLMHTMTDQPVYLDLDISEKEELEYAADNRLRIRLNLIGSYHNYQATPILAELQSIAVNIANYQPEAIKDRNVLPYRRRRAAVAAAAALAEAAWAPAYRAWYGPVRRDYPGVRHAVGQ